jgi:hypothetical protein
VEPDVRKRTKVIVVSSLQNLFMQVRCMLVPFAFASPCDRQAVALLDTATVEFAVDLGSGLPLGKPTVLCL